MCAVGGSNNIPTILNVRPRIGKLLSLVNCWYFILNSAPMSVNFRVRYTISYFFYTAPKGRKFIVMLSFRGKANFWVRLDQSNDWENVHREILLDRKANARGYYNDGLLYEGLGKRHCL